MDELHKQLMEYLYYDPETGLFIWLKQKSNRIKVGSIAGSKNKKGYIRIKFHNVFYLAHRLAWFYVYNQFPTKDLDHVNRNKEDNRLSNLREASKIENNHNKDSKGYCFHKATSKWMAKITTNNIAVYLGLFKTKKEAREAYLKAKREKHLTWSENV